MIDYNVQQLIILLKCFVIYISLTELKKFAATTITYSGVLRRISVII